MPSGAKKRRAARRKKEEETRRVISPGNQDPIIPDQKKSDDDVAATPLFTFSATAVTEKEQKSPESNAGKRTDLCSDKPPDFPENESLLETSIGFVSVKDSISESKEGIPAQSKPENTSMVQESEDKVDQIQNHLSETSINMENIEKTEIPESSEPKALVVRKASWLSCCGLFDVINPTR